MRLRRWRLLSLRVYAGTALVLAGLMATPFFLIAGLLPWAALSALDWQGLRLLFSGTSRAAACAVLVAVSLGLAVAMFTAHFSAPRLRAGIKPAFEILDAALTVVLGLIAAATIAPWLKTRVATVPSSPWSAALVGLALGFASLLLVFSVAEDALLLVPRAHTQAAFALGATRWQVLTSVAMPAAGSGRCSHVGSLAFIR